MWWVCGRMQDACAMRQDREVLVQVAKTKIQQLTMVSDPVALAASITALATVTLDALAPLLALLEDTDTDVRASAAEALSTLDPAAPGASWRREALPAHAVAVVAALADTDPRVRAAACRALGKLEPPELQTHYAVIAQRLASEMDEKVREAAAAQGFSFVSR